MFKSSTFNLSRWFAVVGLISITAISLTTGWLLSRFLTDRMLHEEGRLTQEFVQSIIMVESAYDYFTGHRVLESSAPPQILEHIARMPNVLRANLHSRERRILWSSDQALIGKQFLDNDELEEALSGKLVVHSGEEVKIEHGKLAHDRRNFVEIYAPVHDEARGEVIGVVELYKIPNSLFEAIRIAHRTVWIGAAMAGVFLYLALFWMVRRADNLIHTQHDRLIKSETQAAVGDMGSAVAHGIRNPLASIRSSAELALESEPEHWREAALDIVEQVDRIESWVRQLLSYAEPTSGNREPIEIGTVVLASLLGFERDFERRRIDASVQVAKGLPLVNADTRILEQVFNSLITNAVEAIEHDGRIAVIVESNDGATLRIRIEDSGPGMTSEQLAAAFRPFHTTKAKGIGVGLPLAKRIVERLGGSLVLASTPGKGTTVNVLLPTG